MSDFKVGDEVMFRSEKAAASADIVSPTRDPAKVGEVYVIESFFLNKAAVRITRAEDAGKELMHYPFCPAWIVGASALLRPHELAKGKLAS
mgnify:CR=1 FL=1